MAIDDLVPLPHQIDRGFTLLVAAVASNVISFDGSRVMVNQDTPCGRQSGEQKHAADALCRYSYE